jgi:predicted AAA+ superfamily ATPase
MSLRKESYIDRLVDKKIEDYLAIFGAISIEGPKWCGKTWASLNHANSKVLLDDEEIKEKAKLDLNLILNDEKPELIDEWNIIPEVWDAVRRKCDDTTDKGNYILTCSTKLTDAEQKEKIHHSGAGRIGKIQMHTMSLYESGDSTGKVSIQDMLNDNLQNSLNEKISLDKLAHLIIRGGWPSNIKTEESKANIIPKSYIKAILDKDIHDDKKRDVNKMNMLLKSLARNESTIANKNTLLKDIEERAGEKELIESRITIDDYIDVLSRLHIIENQNAYSENYRSPDRIGKSAKRHFTDPSLACACLDLTKDKLMNDLKTFGFMFEALVERDLKIYMDYLDGKLFHFRDNVTGLEVDSILEFNDGEYAAVEIKLGYNQVEEAKKNLISFSNNMVKKPKFMCVIVGYTDIIAKDPETGIYIVPITALKP